ncbi:hypothetical protein [Vibrio phage BONAISHI]|nr:hypothetical protein [Vibrio phage BONAISHI]
MLVFDTLVQAASVGTSETNYIYVKETQKFYKVTFKENAIRKSVPHNQDTHLLEEALPNLDEFFKTDASKLIFNDVSGRHRVTNSISSDPEEPGTLLLKQDMTKDNLSINAVEINYITQNLDELLETRHYSAGNASSGRHANSPLITGGTERVLVKVMRLPQINGKTFVRQEIHQGHAVNASTKVTFWHRIIELNSNGTIANKSDWLEATIGKSAMDLDGSTNYADVATGTGNVSAGTNTVLSISGVRKGKYLMCAEFNCRAQGSTAGTMVLRPRINSADIPIDDDATIAITGELVGNTDSSFAEYSSVSYHGLINVPSNSSQVQVAVDISIDYRVNSDQNARPNLFLYHLPDFS